RSLDCDIARAPDFRAGDDVAVFINYAWRPILRKEGCAIEVEDVATLAKDERGSHRKAGSDHVADHDAKAEAARLLCHQQAFGKSAALIELDVDDVEAAYRGRQIVQR